MPPVMMLPRPRELGWTATHHLLPLVPPLLLPTPLLPTPLLPTLPSKVHSWMVLLGSCLVAPVTRKVPRPPGLHSKEAGGPDWLNLK